MLKAWASTINRAGTALRDELIRRYPLTHMLLPTRQEDAWMAATVAALGSAPKSVADVLREISLQITPSASGLKSDVDLSAAAAPFIIDALRRIANVTAETMYILSSDGTWVDLGGARFKSLIQAPSKSGYLEIAIVDSSGRLSDRLSINLWRQAGGALEAIGRNVPIKKVIDVDELSAVRTEDEITEPVDVVYTWVNSEDPQWRAMIAPYRELTPVDHDRFAQVDELKYSIRSLFAFAPWVRKVFIFTNCAPPEWFQPSDRVQWMMHDEVIPQGYLPLFNSHAIETFLHRIPGLSERYIYFNDDVFLSGAVRPRDFFNSYGHSVSRMEGPGVMEHLVQRVRTGVAEEWQHAAVNGARLMLQTTGVMPTRLHCHTPHAYTRSTYDELAEAFPQQLEITRGARFRLNTDFTFTSFLFHHFALWKGRAAHIDEDGMIVRASNYARFLDQKIYASKRFFCVNDGGGSAKDPGFRQFKETFLSGHYPFKSPAES